MISIFSGALAFGCTGVTLTHTGSSHCKCKQLKGPNIRQKWISLFSFLFSAPMMRVQIMVIIVVSVKHGSFWNIRNICCVLSARAVGPVCTWNSRTDSPRNRFYVSLAIRIFHLPWMKTSYFLHYDNRATVDGSTLVPAVYFTDQVSTRCQPPNLLSTTTIPICTLQHSSMPAHNQLGYQWTHFLH